MENEDVLDYCCELYTTAGTDYKGTSYIYDAE